MKLKSVLNSPWILVPLVGLAFYWFIWFGLWVACKFWGVGV